MIRAINRILPAPGSGHNFLLATSRNRSDHVPKNGLRAREKSVTPYRCHHRIRGSFRNKLAALRREMQAWMPAITPYYERHYQLWAKDCRVGSAFERDCAKFLVAASFDNRRARPSANRHMSKPSRGKYCSPRMKAAFDRSASNSFCPRWTICPKAGCSATICSARPIHGFHDSS